jgi:hypothetical protein
MGIDYKITKYDSPTQRLRKSILQRRFGGSHLRHPTNVSRSQGSSSRRVSRTNRQQEAYENEERLQAKETKPEEPTKLKTGVGIWDIINYSKYFNPVTASSAVLGTFLKKGYNTAVDLFTTDSREQAEKTAREMERIKTETARAEADRIKAESNIAIKNMEKITDLQNFNFLESIFQRNEKAYYEDYVQSLQEQQQAEILFNRLDQFEQYSDEVQALERAGYPVSSEGLAFSDFVGGTVGEKTGLSPSSGGFASTFNKSLLPIGLVIGGIVLVNNLSKKK